MISKTIVFTVALSLAGAFAVGAQAAPESDARAAWAERHVRLVCQPLEARGLTKRARKCYGDVARAKADTSVDFNDVTASVSPARPAAEIVPDRMNRCVGVSCLSRFPMIGVGY